MKYFTIEELSASNTAKLNKIDNTPSETVAVNLNILGNVLDKIREGWGSGIRVNSGYRCEKLNKLVGGAVNSAHKYGFAADLFPQNGDYEGFVNYMREWAENNDYDQCIQETSGPSKWVHFGLYNKEGRQRKMLFSLDK